MRYESRGAQPEEPPPTRYDHTVPSPSPSAEDAIEPTAGPPGHSGQKESPPRLPGEASDITETVGELEREVRRFRPVLAARLIWLLALVIVLHALLIATKQLTGVSIQDVTPWFNTVFTGLMTLSGSAVGFYFGHKTTSLSRKDTEDGTE